MTSENAARAVFLDRDGVILEERGFLVDPRELRIFRGAPEALARLAGAGFALVVVTNQPVVARGLLTERTVEEIHEALAARLAEDGARIGGFYVCPHHPSGDLEAYRANCDCRKPRAGLLLRAADELGLDLGSSFMVGDRPTDIAAGARAGCRTVLVRSGAHLEPPIETPEPLDPGLRADHVCDDIAAAAAWILASA